MKLPFLLLSLCLGPAFALTSAARTAPAAESADTMMLMASMQPTVQQAGMDYNNINSYMKKLGWEYSEHPNWSQNDDPNGLHCEVIYDSELGQYVFQFHIHANAQILDGDRGKKEDRQRNEMKSQTSSAWNKMNGLLGDCQQLEWKFRIPKDYRPTTSFCHIHQLKAKDGNNSSPVITITLRANSDGSNRRVQVIHTGNTKATTKGTIIDNLPMSQFENEWVQVRERVTYGTNGSYAITMTRVSDGKVLVDKSFTNIDMWRTDAGCIRNKFGIYRSYGRKMADAADRPTNGLKDDSLRLADFKAYKLVPKGETTAITQPRGQAGTVARAYNVAGIRTQSAGKGLYVLVEQAPDGTRRTLKVVR